MTTDHEGPGAPRRDDVDPMFEEKEAVRALYGDRVPTAALEERVVGDWRRAASRARRPGVRLLMQAAALIVAFWAGTRLGSGVPEPPRQDAEDTTRQVAEGADAGPRFVLLIYDDPSEPRPSAEAEGAVVSEYAAWARGIRGSGRQISGERLLDDRLLVAPEGPNPSEQLRLGGYFVVQAADFDEATELAREHPHVRRGGTIEVRPIGPT